MDMADGGGVDFLPPAGRFVGADTASVLLTLPVDERRCLMVDLGTNGEVARRGGSSYKGRLHRLRPRPGGAETSPAGCGHGWGH